jgi:hypothetical protein
MILGQVFDEEPEGKKTTIRCYLVSECEIKLSVAIIIKKYWAMISCKFLVESLKVIILLRKLFLYLTSQEHLKLSIFNVVIQHFRLLKRKILRNVSAI